MKIKNIKVNAYGNIENKDINLEEGINIIHGANESGKSTLLNYIISIFYGISRNKDGKVLSDYEKYKPWNSNEFSGRISYKLENGEKYEIFRDFNKKNPKIYNDKLEDISDRFETDKKDGSKFFIEQMGIDKQMYLSTVVSTQEEVRLDEKNQNMLIQKIANLAGTGEDNVSYKKALIKLQEKIRDEIGTNKTSQKPINIIEKEIVEINNKIVETEKYRNRKYEIDAEKEQILSELKKLEQQKQILQELQNSMKSEEETKNRLEIREKNRKDNIAKINELTNQKNTINAESERVQSAKNHLQDIIKGHKENIEKLNSEIEKIANEKEETQEKEKPSISFIVITVVLAIALICSIILIKNYIVSGILGVAIIANIVFYVINKNKQKVNKAKLREKINQEKQYKREKLENQKQQIIANVNTTEKELEKQEEEEKQVNSELSMLKGQIILLEKNNEKVITTREKDLYYSLDYRSSKANKENCDYFISLHMNSSTNKSAKGVEVWVYDEKSKVYNLAKNICTNLSKDINTPNRGVKISKNFSVLRKTKMPSLLIEIDFISNSTVETSLQSEKYIKDIANTISSSLLAFVNKSIVDDDVFYRVCIGAFKEKSNAILLKNEAISKGFSDAYIY